MTTEYHDPDGVFPLLWPQLSAHLPLRNLYWKSTTRPLRAIASLDIDFVPATSKRSSRYISLDGNASHTSDNGTGTTPTGNEDKAEGQRRHQIPGLRSTPYLKLFLLRCDNKDLYKSTWRPRIRDWIKEHVTLPQKSGALTDHDAFEWLILHVVLPDTAAAAQPRFRAKKDDSGNVKERSSKFPGKRNRPLLEKLRADFNEVGKAGFERVAQIRLARDAVPAGLLRATLPAGVTPITESVQEQAAAWNDLIGKFKSLILASFHLRVAQYEEDVREKELQRSLPGWNFCTFFILKEGLAQAFEAVGLTEDALLGYDELAVGLDSTIIDQLAETTSNQASRLAMSTTALHDLLKKAMQRQRNGSNDGSTSQSALLDVDNKDYRGMIVSNQISVFDFRCYIFLRQMALLLKLARLTPTFQNSKTTLARLSSENTAHKNQDAVPLADLSTRAAQFASLIGRTMRHDFAFGLSEVEEQDQKTSHFIDVIVVSRTFNLLQQILDETVTSAIASPTSMRDTKAKTEPVRTYSFPKRQSSLATTKKEETTKASNLDEDELYLRNLDLSKVEVIKNPELANAAACRADLFVRQRRLLAQLGETRGWRIGSLHHRLSQDTDDEIVMQEQLTTEEISDALGESRRLEQAMSTPQDYQHLYELLSDHAAWFYAVANRTKAAEQLIVDQVLLRFDAGDFAAAAAHFNKLASSFSAQDWNTIEMSILIKYAECLRLLNRKDELVRVRLTILAKSASAARSSVRHGRGRMNTAARDREAQTDKIPFAESNVESHLVHLVAGSRELAYDVITPLATYFELIAVDKDISLEGEGDGFSLGIEIRPFMNAPVHLDSAKIQLVPTNGDKSGELWLQTTKPMDLDNKLNRLCPSCNVNTFGLFRIERVILQTGRILFTHDFSQQAQALTSHMGLEQSRQRQVQTHSVLVYPASGSPSAYMQESPHTHLLKQRYLELVIKVGNSTIHEGRINIRAASAGLRIHTFTATMLNNEDAIQLTSSPGEILLQAGTAHSTLRISVPYQAEYNASELFIKLQIGYRTDAGEFIFKSSSRIDITVPLDVSVQDTIKQDSVLSRFWLRSVTERPILLLDVRLEPSKKYETLPLLKQNLAAVVSKAHPLCVSYRVKHIKDAHTGVGEDDQPLVLRVKYRDIAQDLVSRLMEALRHDLAESPYAMYAGMLSHVLQETMHSAIQAMDFKQAEMSGNIRLPVYRSVGLEGIVQSLRHSTQAELADWVRNWYNAQTPLQLLQNASDSAITTSSIRELLIDVQLPEVTYAFSTSLSIDHPTSAPTLLCGELQAATLRLSYTTKWSRRRHTNREFIYELEVAPDTWLVNGSRIARFEADEGEEIVQILGLVPLKVGVYTLPQLQVRLATPVDDVVLQTELKSQYQTVTVVEGTKSVTVALGAEGELGEPTEIAHAATG